jgi:hypothetical protein
MRIPRMASAGGPRGAVVPQQHVIADYGVGVDTVAQFAQLVNDCEVRLHGQLRPCDPAQRLAFEAWLLLPGPVWASELCCWND